MNIEKSTQPYRGYTIKYKQLKLDGEDDANWIIYNSNKQQIGTRYKSAKEARDYIDEILAP